MTTIFAEATARGRAGVSVIRISGEGAAKVFDVFKVQLPINPREATLRSLYNSHTSEMVDKALILWFPAPHSFTGENVVELHLHGGRAILSEVVDILSTIDGFRLAEAGEFSRQALYNHKMDLAETEGLADLIDAETQMQKKLAISQIGGALSTLCNEFRERIIYLRANMEAYLDFPDEEIPDEVLDGVNSEIEVLGLDIAKMLASARNGEIIRDGFYITIIGSPNAGKSTLINALAKRDVAIVSDIQGTTRDIIEAHLNLGGYAVTIADTAGIRHNPDKIEEEGIRRALEKSKASDLIINLYDGSEIKNNHLETPQNNSESPDSVDVINKIDLIPQGIVDKWLSKGAICISADKMQAIETLESYIKSYISNHLKNIPSAVITRKRHRVAFEMAKEYLEEALVEDALELKAELLRLAGQEIGKITGHVHLDDVLDKLFSSFCIGK